MMWHVVFAERDGRVASRAARLRDFAIYCTSNSFLLALSIWLVAVQAPE